MRGYSSSCKNFSFFSFVKLIFYTEKRIKKRINFAKILQNGFQHVKAHQIAHLSRWLTGY